MEAPGSTQGPKADLSQRSQELRVLVALQEQGGKIFAQSCEEKLRQNRELLPSLQAALQEDSSILDFVLKYNKLPIKDAFGEGQELIPATQSVEAVQKKIEAKIHDQVKVCDMLLHQLKQWSQARDERQRHLQELQDAETDPKWQEPQLQTIRQLGNDIEKMVMKIHSGQIVTNLYLKLQENLRRELVYLPQYLDLLCGMTVMYHDELTARSNLKANDVLRKLMAEAGPQVRVEKQLRDQSLAEQRMQIESLRQQEESERQQRRQAVSMLSAEHELSSSETAVGECLAGGRAGGRGRGHGHPAPLLPCHPGAEAEAAVAKREREAFVTDKMEKAKSALQCSCLWDIPSSIQAQKKSLESLQQHIDECRERKKVLKKTLQELELKQAKLKFSQPISTIRCCWPRTVVPTRPPPLGGHVPGGTLTSVPLQPPSPRALGGSRAPGSGAGREPKASPGVPELPFSLPGTGSAASSMELGCSWGWGEPEPFGAALGCPCAPLQLCDVSATGSRLREEELSENLQQEEARLEQMRAQMLRNQKRLIEFENIIDNLFLRLQGIFIPDQDESVAVVGLEEKLQHCEQKMQLLKERVAARPKDSTDERSETFAKVRNLLEKRTAGETQNLKISFEDEDTMEDGRRAWHHQVLQVALGCWGGKAQEDSRGSHKPHKLCQLSQGRGHSRGGPQPLPSPSCPLSPPDTLDFEDEDHDYIPSREDIKKQGLQLIRMNTRRRKKK
ncbi:LOW QUALITY PROTEIN: coiled-coil domain-containing protein 183 [Corvus cornix cornix]|uniref:LOW QUALITY PROTEIN: coiled-coil domain-containing protein 183 n=1 Tax=Corvus cornix cornix TaxID=932674 RepID=UPI00194DC192|nr:LOW QUALITY PROTEIN: coiled-coil domain-containing protein 183 [Corvus cornix cornix]